MQKQTLRTPETEEKYRAFLKTPEAQIPFFWDRATIVSEYKYWRICENDFPYDRWYEKHLLLAPIRKVKTFSELTFEEIVEFENIKQFNFGADQSLENLHGTQSIPDHLHYHIVRLIRNSSTKP